MLYNGSLLFFHQAPQKVKQESGAKGEEEIGDSKEQFYKLIKLSISYGLKKLRSITTFMETTLLYCIHRYMLF